MKLSKASFRNPLTRIVILVCLIAAIALFPQFLLRKVQRYQASVSVAIAAEQIADMVVHHIVASGIAPQNWEELEDDFTATDAAYNNFEFEELRQMVEVEYRNFSKVGEIPDIELVIAKSKEFESVAAIEDANRKIRSVLRKAKDKDH